jgi:hypothetical protein
MAIKRVTEGPKAKLMKLSVATLRKKAKALNISDYTKRTKENLVQSIIVTENRKKVGKTSAVKKAPVRKAAGQTALRLTRSGEQTGRSDAARDMLRRAKAPGKRLSKTGKVYYERRRNRSDVPPTMLGEKYNGWTNYWTWRWNLEMIDAYQIWDEIDGDMSVYDLAQYLKEQAQELVDMSASDWAASWLYAVLDDVNWREIAESVIADKE